MTMSKDQKVTIELTKDEALVLFDWLGRFNAMEGKVFEDRAEQRVLWDIESMLEAVLVEPLVRGYGSAVAEARSRVRDATE